MKKQLLTKKSFKALMLPLVIGIVSVLKVKALNKEYPMFKRRYLDEE